MLLKLDERTDPRIRRTRLLIMQSFESLLAEKNFANISVQDVTDKAQINRATFYAHFQDKYDLLNQAINEMFMLEIEKRTLNVCSYSVENLRSLILVVCEFLSRLRSDCAQPQNQFESLVETTIKNQISDLLSYWLKNSKTTTELPLTVATSAIYGLASNYSRRKKRPALEAFVDEALPLVAVNLEQFL
ncbi:MAG: TetR family transcriptional regulator [Chloroflexi bacterium]|nr:TetR family transcriptional regulator [Chloroflexota bacterium]